MFLTSYTVLCTQELRIKTAKITERYIINSRFTNIASFSPRALDATSPFSPLRRFNIYHIVYYVKSYHAYVPCGIRRHKHADFACLLAAIFNRMNHAKIGSVWRRAGFGTQPVLCGSSHSLFLIP
jgi:hypothetical protein